MSSAGLLLLFLRDGVAPPERWLRLRGGAVVGRGNSFPPPDAAKDVAERVIAIVPGEDVTIRWVALPALAPRQAAAAARLLAAEESAAPLDSVHVALGCLGEKAERPIALVSLDRMRAWLDQAQALGYDPDHILPEPMLLTPPPQGAWSWTRADRCIVRGDALAYAAEPALAAEVAGGPLTLITDEQVEQGLMQALASPMLDLRQGTFARRRRWRPEAGVARRLALLVGAILLLTLGTQFTLLLRYNVAADRMEQQAHTIAREALPRAASLPNPPAQLAERLAALRGGGLGFPRSAAALFAAMRDTPQVELSALLFDGSGVLRATVTAATAADIAALQQRLGAAGFAVESGGVHPGGGRQIADLTVRAR